MMIEKEVIEKKKLKKFYNEQIFRFQFKFTQKNFNLKLVRQDKKK